jgi:ATP/maltotriose-dependent transcriptional regulator MalT
VAPDHRQTHVDGEDVHELSLGASGYIAKDADRSELEILTILAGGASAPEIATQLHLSPATVKTHLHNVYAKFGVSDRAAAVAEGMRRGLIS